MVSGGYRPGAGRPKGKKPGNAPVSVTPLEYMLAVVNDPTADLSRRDRMAIAAAPFVHGRAFDLASTKQDHRKDAAGKAAEMFTVPQPPRLVRVN